MKKQFFLRGLCLALLLVLCLGLTACGKSGSAARTTAPTEPTPEPTPAPVRFSAGEVEYTAQTLRMPLASGETVLLDTLPYLQSADLSGSANEEEVARWAAAHPQVQTRYSVTLPNGTVLDTDTESVDLSSATAAEAEAAAYKLAMLPGLKSVNLGAEGRGLAWSDIARLRQILPNTVFKYAFKLYGVDCDLSDTTINLFRVSVPDDGRFVDEVMGYMPQLTYVDMDSCGLQPKRLEEINLNHPNAKVVFRVFFGDNYTARTDAERILASMASRGGMLTNDNVQGLYYCHDVKYLDLGHNTLLTNIGFVAQMPKLEVAILSMCNIPDATPLASCPNLEYLEIANTYISDLRPLSGLMNLRHLNVAGIGYDQPYDGSARIELKDITPLYPLTGLERLWIGAYNPVPAEQVQEMQRRAPNCEIDLSVYEDPVGGRWRYIDLANYVDTWVDTYHPRYEKLREQFGDYEYTAFNFTWNDPKYDANYVPAATPAPAVTPVPTAQAQPQYQPQYQQEYQPQYEPEYQPEYQPQYEPEYQPGYEESYQPTYDPNQNYWYTNDPYAQQNPDTGTQIPANTGAWEQSITPSVPSVPTVTQDDLTVTTLAPPDNAEGEAFTIG